MSAPVAVAGTDRLTRLRARVGAAGLDAVVLTKPQNVTYMTGFAGSAGIAIVTQPEVYLILDFRYLEQAAAQAPLCRRVKANGPLIDAAAGVLRETAVRRIGVEADAMPVGSFRRLQNALEPAEISPLEGLDHLRWQKGPDEIDAMRRAAAIADAAFAAVLPAIRPGAIEREIAAALEYELRRRGSERMPFDLIVASGPRSALPHGIASDRVIGNGEFVSIDFGAVTSGYNSDCTRTLVTAPVSEQHRRVYDVVLSAQMAALEKLRAGMLGREADAVARILITEAGFGEAFGHSLGHGVGLAVHEGPTLSPREEASVPAGAVVTVEPGIYLPGWGGVRIEDLVVVTDSGCDVLTHLPKTLHEVSA
ncbi:MAG: M24 family metallopeptidase [Armatimonadota bacterium]